MDSHTAEALGAAFAEARETEGPAAVRLAIYADALRRYLPVYNASVERLVSRLNQVGAGLSAPDVGDSLPPFLLPDQHGRLVSLAELHTTGPAAIVMLRGHWCPFCRLYMRTLAAAHIRASALGATIVTISPERQHFARIQVAEAGTGMPVLSDISSGYALSLNLAIWVGTEMQSMLKEMGRDLSQYHGNDHWILPIPAAFVVDRTGRVTERFVDPDFRNRMDVDRLVAALERAAATHQRDIAEDGPL